MIVFFPARGTATAGDNAPLRPWHEPGGDECAVELGDVTVLSEEYAVRAASKSASLASRSSVAAASRPAGEPTVAIAPFSACADIRSASPSFRLNASSMRR